jgi:hypothetical protein
VFKGPVVVPGEELRELGSGKKVLVTGLGWKVTVRVGLGRSGSRSRGVRSELGGFVEDDASDEAIAGG